MAKIILGMGTSQSSLLAIDPANWADQGKLDIAGAGREIYRSDGTIVSYQHLAAEAGDKFADLVALPQFSKLAAAAKIAVERLGDELAQANPDLLVVIADDHSELFETTNLPAISIYRGQELASFRPELNTAAPLWQQARRAAALIDPAKHYPAAPAFADEIIDRLIKKEIDVGAAIDPVDIEKRGIGHAWAFVINRLLKGRSVPILPIILNVWYPPNILTPARCYHIGKALRIAIEESPQDLRVAVIAAGGLSHFLINEALDRKLMAAFRGNDAATLSSLPIEALRGGTAQIRNWVMMAGAVAGLTN